MGGGPLLTRTLDIMDEVALPLMRTVNNGLFTRRPFDWDRPVEDEDVDMELVANR